MGKLSQVNQFNGGMVKDLHPLNTPNTVLTDCLNGTLLTYNGNEFVLQNDMGNYAFTNGSLSKNFVPVGLKEYNGILYIISYNPIDNKVEIGSFPSQQTIWNSNNSSGESELSFLKLTETYNKFSKIQTNIIQLSNNKDINLFLNPGDKYLLKCKGEDGSYTDLINEKNENLNWQHLNLYALTDENKLYKINSYIQFSTTDVETNEDYTPINWEIPGWLAASFELNTPDEFSAYFDIIGSTINESNGNYEIYNSGILKLKTIWDTKIYKNNIKYLKDNLVFIFHNIINDFENDTYIHQESMTELNYNNIQTILHCTYDMSSKFNYVTPALKVNDKYIIYDQFTTSLQYNEQIIDANEISLGEETFKYIVDSDSVTFTFDFKAYPGVKLGYNIYRYSDPRYSDNIEYVKVQLNSGSTTVIEEDGKEEEWYIIGDINYNGINIFDIPFSEDQNKYSFDKEDIYLIKFKTFIETAPSTNTPLKSEIEDKILYISEVTNYFSSNNKYSFDYEGWANNVSLGLAVNVKNLDSSLEFDNSTYSIETQPLMLNNVKEIKEAQTFEETAYEEGTSELDYEKLVNYYGDGFRNNYIEKPLTGTVLYNSINKYKLQEHNPSSSNFELKVPTNQYGERGRLWIDSELSSISNQSSIIDTLNKSHLLSIKGDNIDNEYFDINSEVSLDLKDQYVLSVSSQDFTTNSSSSDLLPYEIDKTQYLKLNENIGTLENPVFKLSSFIRFVTVSGDDFIAEVSVLEYPIYGTFVDNVLYAGDTSFYGTNNIEENIKNIKNGTAPEIVKEHYRVNNYADLKLEGVYNEVVSNNYIRTYPKIKENHRIITSDMSRTSSWLDSDVLKVIHNTLSGIIPIIYESRANDSNKKIKIDTVIDNHGQFAYGLYINSSDNDRPFGMLYSKDWSNQYTQDASMLRESVSYWFTLMNYMKICNGVQENKYYVTYIDKKHNEFKNYTTKQLNISCRYEWNYSSIPLDENLITKTISGLYNELNSSSNNIIRTKILISKAMYFQEDQTDQKLELLIDEINKVHLNLYNTYNSQEKLSRFSAYLISDYSEDINLAKLKKIVPLIQYSSNKSKLIIENDDSLNVGVISLGFASRFFVHVSQVFSEIAKY